MSNGGGRERDLVLAPNEYANPITHGSPVVIAPGVTKRYGPLALTVHVDTLALNRREIRSKGEELAGRGRAPCVGQRVATTTDMDDRPEPARYRDAVGCQQPTLGRPPRRRRLPARDQTGCSLAEGDHDPAPR